MNRSEREVLEKLGRGGLRSVLEELLDHGRLLRLANAVALSYPGMRMQSQKRERILGDLADKALREDAAGRSVVRTLRKQLAKPAHEWSDATPEERRRRLGDASRLDGAAGLGLCIFLAASAAPEDDVEQALDALLAHVSVAASPASANGPANGPGPEAGERDVARLRKKSAELQKKVRHLETQIAKNRDGEKILKRDLMQRKGELAEARMLAERLRRELEEARVGAGPAPAKPAPGAAAPSDGALAEIERTLKRLAADHRKLAHRVEKVVDAPPPAPAEIAPVALEEIRTAVAEVGRDVAALRRERKKDLQDQAKRLEEVQAALRSDREATEPSVRPASRPLPRRKGDPERVGVFIDVQNVYYGARQLKGKLDFDALLQAAVLDRRLIQATAYVVETKEIDQSGFIARLQQRAIEVRRKTLQIRADGSMKGDWDMEMALDILDMAPKLDVVVLVSGDGDFTSLVKRVKGMGPKVEVLGFPRTTAKALLEAADRFQPLDRRYMIRSADTEPERPPAPVAVSEG